MLSYPTNGIQKERFAAAGRSIGLTNTGYLAVCAIFGHTTGKLSSTLKTFFYNCPVGELRIVMDREKIASIHFVDGERSAAPEDEKDAYFSECSSQLDRYFNGELFDFNLSLSDNGTEFQKRVWQRLVQIPYGHTMSYHRLSVELGNPHYIRAAASANGRNPLPIIVPCHRVIGKDGSLTGYSGGLWRKKWLLDHERKHSGKMLNKGYQLELF